MFLISLLPPIIPIYYLTIMSLLPGIIITIIPRTNVIFKLPGNALLFLFKPIH